MRRGLRTLTLLAAVLGLMAMRPQEPAPTHPPRFVAQDVFVDTGDHELAAWQIWFRVAGKGARIVGVEGGEHPAFTDAPYYDPEALQGGRIIVAAFSTETDLPSGRTRVARIHLIVDSDANPHFDITLEACAGPDGARIDATAETNLTENR
jgi:hypothetical protein